METPNEIFWVQREIGAMQQAPSFWLSTLIFGTLIDVKVLMYEKVDFSFKLL